MKLSSNNKLHSLPDTPQHHLRRVLCSLNTAKKGSDYEATFTYASGLTANNETDVKSLLLKHSDLIKAFEWLYQIPSFRDYGFHPKRLVQAKKTIWGVVDAFVQGGKIQLTFLGRTIPEQIMKMFDGENCIPGTFKLCNFLQSKNYQLHDPALLWFFVRTADAIYQEHLHPVIAYFGQGSTAWTEAFNTYKDALRRKLRAERRGMTEEGKKKVDELLVKLTLILEKGATVGIKCVPKLDGSVPVLCPSFLNDLMDLLFNVEPVLELVSAINSLTQFQA